jgi:hypothetical protein
LIGLDIERKGHIVADQIEAVVVDYAIDIAPGAGEEVIDADEVGAVLEQALAQMRAEKTGTAGHNHTGFEMHRPPPPKKPVPIAAYGFSLSIAGKPPDQDVKSLRVFGLKRKSSKDALYPLFPRQKVALAE